MKLRYIILVVVICQLLSSCGIYTNYTREEPLSVPVDSLYRNYITGGDSVSFAKLSWQEIFTDPCLVNWIQTGLDNNMDLRVARLRTQEARIALNTSKLAFLPSLSLEAEGGLNSYGGSKTAKTYSIGTSANWEIDAFGRVRNDVKGKNADYLASEAYEQAVVTQLVATIADTYYSLIALDIKLGILKETVAKWEENVRVMEALKRSGEQSDAAVTQSQANLLQAQASVVSLEREIQTLENSFSTLLGLTSRKITRSQQLKLDIKTELTIGVPMELLSRRPDVRQKEWELAKAFYAVNSARSEFYPRITLSGSAGFTNNAGTIVNPGNWLLNAIGGLTQPLFNRGTNIANLRIAKLQQEEATVAFAKSLLDAGEEVNNAIIQLENARYLSTIDEKRVEVLTATVNSTEKLMRHSNSTTYLEVLTAQQELLSAQLNNVTNQYDVIQATINLYHALGGGI